MYRQKARAMASFSAVTFEISWKSMMT